MKTAIRRMGNSQGVIIPKAILQQTGMRDAVDMAVEDGHIVLRAIVPTVRAGWAEAGAAIAAADDDAPEWREVPCPGDDELRW